MLVSKPPDRGGEVSAKAEGQAVAITPSVESFPGLDALSDLEIGQSSHAALLPCDSGGPPV